MPEEKIERKIRLFAMTVQDTDGAPWKDQGVLWKRCQGMPLVAKKAGDPERIELMDTEYLAIEMKSVGNLRARGLFERVKYRDVPRIKNLKEETRDVPLADDEGLEFPAHFCWWDFSTFPLLPNAQPMPPVGLLAMESALGAPRVSLLADYLNGMFQGEFSCIIAPIVDAEAIERVKNSTVIGKIHVKMGRTARQTANVSAPGLMSAWVEAPPECSTIEVFLRPARRRKFGTMAIIDRLVSWANMEAVEALEVDLENEPIDLLGHHTMYRVQVAKASEKSKHVDTNSVLTEISRVVTQNKKHIAGMLGRVWKDPE